MLKNLGVFKDFSDESLKSVFQSENGIIEMTLLFNKESMDVVCVPTHHFCSLGCKMCHLTNNKLNKKMVGVLFDDFYLALINSVCKDGKRRTLKDKLLISFMGVGEPLLNLSLIEEVFKHEEEIKTELGYESISYAVSTMMPNKDVIKLTELVNKYNKPLKLHFSLHTPIDEERKNLIPSTNVSVEEALELLLYYRKYVINNDVIMRDYVKFHRTYDPVEIHYTLIDGINDGYKELEAMYSLLSLYHISVKFIRFNPKADMKVSKMEDKWREKLSTIEDLRIKTYSPPGREIGSSCGEFTKHYYHEKIETEEQLEEFLEWKKLHQVETLILKKNSI